MKGFKKTCLGIVGGVLSAALLLTGCGGGGAGTGGKSNEKDLVWYTVGNTPEDLDKVMEEASKITRVKIGVGIRLNVTSWGDYTKKIQTMLNAGEEFDICFTNRGQIDNMRKGYFTELTDLLNNQGKDMLEIIPEKMFDLAKIDGKLYGIPNNKEYAREIAWVVNVPIAEKYGIDYKNEITTMAEIEPLLEKVKQGEGPGFAPLLPSAATMDGLPYEFVGQAGETVFGTELNYENPEDVDHKIVNVFETEKTMEYLKTMHRYQEKGYLPQDLTSGADYEKKGSWFLNLVAYQPEYEVAESVIKGYKVDSVYRHTPICLNTCGSMNGIPITCKRPEKAMEFLNLLNTDRELRNLVGYGIKGEHYNLNEDGKRVVTPEGKARYTGLSNHAMGNLLLTDLDENDRDDKWERFEEFNQSSVDSPLMGFFFDSEPVKNEMSAISNVISEYVKDLMAGRVDPEVVVPEFLQKLKAVGSEKVQAEMQKQYDAFLASKK